MPAEQLVGHVDVHLVVSAADAEDGVLVDQLVDAQLHAGHVRLEAQMVAGRPLAVEHAEGIDPHRAGAVDLLRFAHHVLLAGTILGRLGQLGGAAHGLGKRRRSLVRRRLEEPGVGLAGAAVAEIPAQRFGHVLRRAIGGGADAQVRGRADLLKCGVESGRVGKQHAVQPVGVVAGRRGGVAVQGRGNCRTVAGRGDRTERRDVLQREHVIVAVFGPHNIEERGVEADRGVRVGQRAGGDRAVKVAGTEHTATLAAVNDVNDAAGRQRGRVGNLQVVANHRAERRPGISTSSLPP